MSSEVSISLKSISKTFALYANSQDRLKQFIYPRFRRMLNLEDRGYFESFEALSDISFSLNRGETMGIIGRNGAGKSTLLQIVCGVLSASSGSVQINGRVAALLELGSGFNPEFSGRENVYLNAAILGLSRDEIDQRYDDIVAFADIGNFVNQPVKTYSSGMMLRLAFAVIAHVDADILIVDEALAVGDAVFTQKCMRWLRNFQRDGTILFVSHDAASIRALCTRALWLHEGKCVEIGDAKDVTESYMRFTQQEIAGEEISLKKIHGKVAPEAPSPDKQHGIVGYKSAMQLFGDLDDARGFNTGDAEVVDVAIDNLDDPSSTVLEGGEKIRLRITGLAHRDVTQPIIGFYICDKYGQELLGDNTLKSTEGKNMAVSAGEYITAEFVFRVPFFPNGNYEILTSFAEGTLHDHRQMHWLFNAGILRVSSSSVRWGLVGVHFEDISLTVGAPQL